MTQLERAYNELNQLPGSLVLETVYSSLNSILMEAVGGDDGSIDQKWTGLCHVLASLKELKFHMRILRRESQDHL